jgi:hypothetical protein
MIAFACIILVVTYSWFGFNAIIVLHTHLFELTFEFTPTTIVKYNKLRSGVTCQPGVMKQILGGCCWLIFYFENFKPTSAVFLFLSLWVQAESVFWLVSLLEMDPPDPQKPWPKGQIQIFWVGVAHISFALSLLFDILDKWNINVQKICLRPFHIIVFLIVFSVIVCPGWSKYSW